jgi:hypothetical protein
VSSDEEKGLYIICTFIFSCRYLWLFCSQRQCTVIVNFFRTILISQRNCSNALTFYKVKRLKCIFSASNIYFMKIIHPAGTRIASRKTPLSVSASLVMCLNPTCDIDMYVQFYHADYYESVISALLYRYNSF